MQERYVFQAKCGNSRGTRTQTLRIVGRRPTTSDVVRACGAADHLLLLLVSVLSQRQPLVLAGRVQYGDLDAMWPAGSDCASARDELSHSVQSISRKCARRQLCPWDAPPDAPRSRSTCELGQARQRRAIAGRLGAEAEAQPELFRLSDGHRGGQRGGGRCATTPGGPRHGAA